MSFLGNNSPFDETSADEELISPRMGIPFPHGSSNASASDVDLGPSMDKTTTSNLDLLDKERDLSSFNENAQALLRDLHRQSSSTSSSTSISTRPKPKKLPIPINTCIEDHIRYAKGIGERRAEKILSLRKMMHSTGMDLTREALVTFKIGLSEEIMNQFDFSPSVQKNVSTAPDTRLNDRHNLDTGRPIRQSRVNFKLPPDDFDRDAGRAIRQEPLEDQDRGFRPNRHRHIQIPKGLEYNGTTCFSTFREKFRKYLFRENFEDEESSLFALSLALRDKASDFFERASSHGQFHSVLGALDALKRRFDSTNHWRTASLQLHSAMQAEDESPQEFEDRLWMLGHQAYPTGSAQQVEREVLQRFILGLKDKGAVQHLSLQNHNSVREAADGLRVYEYSMSVASVRPTRNVRSVRVEPSPLDTEYFDSDVDLYPQVRQVQNNPPHFQKSSSGSSTLERIEGTLNDLTKVMKDMALVMNNLASEVKDMRGDIRQLRKQRTDEQHTDVQQRGRADTRVTFKDQSRSFPPNRNSSFSPNRNSSASPNRSNSFSPSRRCFVCDSPNHFKSDCPQLKRRVRYLNTTESDEDFRDVQVRNNYG